MNTIKKTFAVVSLAYLTGSCAAMDMTNMMTYNSFNRAGTPEETHTPLSREDMFSSYFVSDGHAYTAGPLSVAEHVLSPDGKTEKVILYDIYSKTASEIDYRNKDGHEFTTKRDDRQTFNNNKEKIYEIWDIIHGINSSTDTDKTAPYGFANICVDPYINQHKLYPQCEPV